MSAIVSLFYLDGRPADRFDVRRMADVLAHRGTDDSGVWCAGSVGLGHRMMWTTPESLDEHLPSTNESGDLAITADARLDNRDELIKQLALSKRDAVSDSQLILAAYERWGEQCLEKFLGDFAFAIWDGRRQTLFCARDLFGVKHFYYHHRPHQMFALASELKALLCLPEVPQRLNELSIADHLLPTYEDRVSTLYEDVLRLPAAHCLTVNRDGMKIRRYWEPDLSRELRLRSNEEYAEGFREIFTEAVRCRLRSAFPVGSMLSGGLDSSSIACTASRLLDRENDSRKLHTFSGIFPGLADAAPEIDERRYVNAVLASGDFNPHFVAADAVSPLTDIHKIFWHMDNAVPATNMYMDWEIFRAAREEGVRILFSGNDGDSVVSFGYNDLPDFIRRGWLRTAVKESIALHRGVPLRPRRLKKFILNYILKPVVQPLVPEYAKQGWRAVRGRTSAADRDAELHSYCRERPINPDFAKRVRLAERFWDLQNSSFPKQVSSREVHWRQLASGMDSFLMESFEKASAAFSIESRYPFFDQRLVEFCLALPPGQRLQNGWTRSILRRAMNKILPPEVQWRKGKSDISAGIKVGLLNYERETLEDIILNDSGVIREYVDVPALQAAYERYAANPMESEQDNYSIALIVNLALWLRNSSLSIKSTNQEKELSYSVANV